MQATDHSEDLALLVAAAHAAAPIAMEFRTPEVWDKPDGAGPVCEADLAVDAMLRSAGFAPVARPEPEVRLCLRAGRGEAVEPPPRIAPPA